MSPFMPLLVVVSLHLTDAPRPNTLTPKEAADGWVLLFDGGSTVGVPADGDARAAAGELILGGAENTRLTFPFPAFEFRAEFRDLEGARAGSLVLERTAAAAASVSRITFPRFSHTTDWNTCSIVLRRDDTLGPNDTRTSANNRSESGHPGVFDASMTCGPGQARSYLEFPAGTRIALRSVKIRPTGMAAVFNGKDLTGWKEYPGKKSAFAVTPDGLLSIKNGPGDLQTEAAWADFVLQIGCKTNGPRLNSGVFFRCRPGEYEQGYEAQIQNDFSADPPKKYAVEEYDPRTNALVKKTTVLSAAADYGTGAIYRRVPARTGVAKDNEWFTMTVMARGRRIITWVDGVPVVDWTDNRPASDNARNGCRLEAGRISLQGHDPTTDLVFRDIRILDLTTPAAGR